MIQSITNNTVNCKCDDCGREFSFESELGWMKRNNIFSDTMLSLYNQQKCETCAEKARKELEAERERRWRAELEESLDARETDAGFPKKFRCMEAPFMRNAAAFFYKNRNESLIVSGKTGTGKTSSALFVLGLMMKKQYLKVKYCTWQSLVSSYVRAKTSDHDSEEEFFARLGVFDYIVVDELVGKKGDSMLSDSSQEFLFNLVDGVYSEERKAKVWILGNFYDGALETMVADVEPLKRRLRTSFKPAVLVFLPDESDVAINESVII